MAETCQQPGYIAPKWGAIMGTRRPAVEGEVFGRWTVVADASPGTGKSASLCQCVCGYRKIVQNFDLRSGHSGGCRRCVPHGPRSAMWQGHGEISRTHWREIQRNATHNGRSFSFSITIEEVHDLFLAQGRRCALSGVPLTFTHGGKENRVAGTASLDRIDNTRGYEPDNIQWVHKDVNRMKTNFSDEEFVAMCCRVADHHRSGG